MTGLVGWWSLNEDSGSTAYDLSGNGNHGSLNGGVTQGVAGKGGLTACSFDGSDDEIVTDSDIVNSDSSFTLSAWVNVGGTTGSGQYIASNRDGGNSEWKGFLIGIYASTNTDVLHFYLNDGTDSILLGNTGIDDGNWHHVLVKYDPDKSTRELWIDGSLDASDNPSLGNTSSANPFMIGSQNSVGNWNGEISDLRIYNRAISPQEVQELYKQGSGDFTTRSLSDGSDSGAVSRWKFDSSADDSWSNNNGTLNGSLDSASFVGDSVRGEALSFDSSNNDYVGIPDDALVGGSDPRTVSTWVNPSTLTDNYTCVGWGELSTSKSWNIQLNSTNDGEIFVMCWDNNFKTGKKVLKKDAWNHIVVTYDGTGDEDSIKAYVNGSRKDLVVHAGDWTQLNTTIDNGGIGRRSANNDLYFDGKIDDVRIYNRALSPSEVFELYQWGTRGRDLRKQLVNSRGL